MSVLEKLASALGRNDEAPNLALAEALAVKPDAAAIAGLVAALSGPTAQRSDAIKVLYELGARDPAQLAPHLAAFLALLDTRDNRLLWGLLEAVVRIAPLRPAEVLAAVPRLLAAADRGSVIARDNAVELLAALAGAGHGARSLPLLLDRLEAAAPNQFPMYAERAAAVIDAAHARRFKAILETRLATIEQPTRRSRVTKLLKRLK